MKHTVFLIAIIFLFTACKDEVTKEDCIKDGKKYKTEKFLNYRTGEKESRVICIDK